MSFAFLSARRPLLMAYEVPFKGVINEVALDGRTDGRMVTPQRAGRRLPSQIT